jgi:hypothetical protein
MNSLFVVTWETSGKAIGALSHDFTLFTASFSNFHESTQGRTQDYSPGGTNTYMLKYVPINANVFKVISVRRMLIATTYGIIHSDSQDRKCHLE